MEENEITKKEIALTGKFCVVRALKKIPKDAIQEELMKIKGRPLSTDFTRPEWFPYRIDCSTDVGFITLCNY
jgi:hypothetical protein